VLAGGCPNKYDQASAGGGRAYLIGRRRRREEDQMNSTKADTWDRVVTGSDQSKFYHLYQWGTLLNEVHGHKLVYLQEDNGVFPLACVKSLFFGKRLISLPFADYGGPCAQDENTAEKLISECEEMGQRLAVDFIEIRSPSSQYFQRLEAHGFVRRDDYLTFILRLDKGIDGLWKDIGDKTRNRVRKAEKSDIHLVYAASKSDLQAFYLLYCKTMKRLGSPPQPYRYFERIWDLFYPANMIMPLASRHGKYVAGGLIFLKSKQMHFAYSCSLSEYLPLAPNDLVWWDAIKWGSEHGFSCLDLGRTREGEDTVTFKKRWHGESVQMPYFYKFWGKTLDQRQEIKYRRISQLWSRYVPEFVANKVGPLIIKQIG